VVYGLNALMDRGCIKAANFKNRRTSRHTCTS
jgi:hypothetical protein